MIAVLAAGAIAAYVRWRVARGGWSTAHAGRRTLALAVGFAALGALEALAVRW